MIVIYECENCGEEYSNSKGNIFNCARCDDEICIYCKHQGKDENYYCDICVDKANKEYDRNNEE